MVDWGDAAAGGAGAVEGAAEEAEEAEEAGAAGMETFFAGFFRGREERGLGRRVVAAE